MIRRSIVRRSGGRRVAAESVSRSRPSSTSWRMSAEVNVLLTLAKANAVSGVTFVPAATSASPLTPVHVVPSGRRIVADTPGIASLTRIRSSAAWSRRPSRAAGWSGPVGPPDAPGGARRRRAARRRNLRCAVRRVAGRRGRGARHRGGRAARRARRTDRRRGPGDHIGGRSPEPGRGVEESRPEDDDPDRRRGDDRETTERRGSVRAAPAGDGHELRGGVGHVGATIPPADGPPVGSVRDAPASPRLEAAWSDPSGSSASGRPRSRR